MREVERRRRSGCTLFGVYQRKPAQQTTPNADATQEYRGPIDEVVTDATMELVLDEPARRPLRRTLAPLALDARRPEAPKRRMPPPRRSPDASLEFPHPVSPELFADWDDERFPELDDVLPARRPPPRWGFFVFTGAMVVAGVVIGLALGSGSGVSTIATTANAAPPKAVATTSAAPVVAEEPKPPPPVAIEPIGKPRGTITSPKWASGRRVFVDDRDVGVSGTVDAECGDHVVKIGLKGKARKVTVPCGGKVTVLP